MGVSSVLFVATKPENILQIMPKVIDAINVWQRAELDQYWDRKGFDSRAMFLFRNKESEVNKGLKDFTNGIYDTSTSNFRSFITQFKVYGNSRALFCTHTCSSDYSDTYDGDKIIFSLGSWGLSEKIMMVVSDVVKEYGDVYFTNNDCEDDFEKIA